MFQINKLNQSQTNFSHTRLPPIHKRRKQTVKSYTASQRKKRKKANKTQKSIYTRTNLQNCNWIECIFFFVIPMQTWVERQPCIIVLIFFFCVHVIFITINILYDKDFNKFDRVTAVYITLNEMDIHMMGVNILVSGSNEL